MAEPTTPLPAEGDEFAASERVTLEAFLRYHRAVLARKAEGLTDEQARVAACPPSDMTLLGLVRHMADVERIWAQWLFAGGANEPIFYGDAHPGADPDGDFHPPEGATLDEAFDAYWAQIAAADEVYAAAELDEIERAGDRRRSLRWIYVHLIEEYARHCGHADLIRQAIDGATGD
jgi:hypothetical protein